MRQSIYVGKDLKARMDAVKDPPNWSEIACRAFEAALGEIAAKKERKTMQDVVQRLRASKAKMQSDSESKGAKEGRNWASNKASFEQLKRLADKFEVNDLGEWSGGLVGCIVDPDNCSSEQDGYRYFWKDVSDIEPDDSAAVRAFAVAAIEVYEAVAEKL